MTFAYGTHAVRVVFGAGSLAQLPDELDRAGLRRVLLLATPSRPADRERVTGLVGARLAAEYAGARLHVPVDVVRDARARLDRSQPASLLAFGGGSAIGLGKALAFETGLPLAVIATTYSGSEMTSIWGHTEGQVKHTFRHAQVAPRLVLYDPRLTMALSAAVSAASGMNAIAHCVEAAYAPEQGPVTSWFALEGIRLLAAHLPRVTREAHNEDARAGALLGAHYAGRALDMTSMGLHHKLAHIMGGTFGLNHAEAHAALLPWVTAFNAPAAPDAMRRIAGALGGDDASLGLLGLSRTLGIRSLGSLGFTVDDIPRAVEAALGLAFPNPRPVDAGGVRWILERAIAGA